MGSTALGKPLCLEFKAPDSYVTLGESPLPYPNAEVYVVHLTSSQENKNACEKAFTSGALSVLALSFHSHTGTTEI